jgi:hypothetical protein
MLWMKLNSLSDLVYSISVSSGFEIYRTLILCNCWKITSRTHLVHSFRSQSEHFSYLYTHLTLTLGSDFYWLLLTFYSIIGIFPSTCSFSLTIHCATCLLDKALCLDLWTTPNNLT